MLLVDKSLLSFTISRGWDSVRYKKPSIWVEFLDFQAPQLQMSERKEPSPRFWGLQEAAPPFRDRDQGQLTLHLLAFGESIFWG